jgi:hypothetical protein
VSGAGSAAVGMIGEGLSAGPGALPPSLSGERVLCLWDSTAASGKRTPAATLTVDAPPVTVDFISTDKVGGRPQAAGADG